MKIAFVNWYNVDEPYSGGKLRILNLVKGLGSNNNVILISPVCNSANRASELFRQIPIPIDIARKIFGINIGIFNFFIPFNFVKSYNTLIRFKPDIVISEHIWSFIPALAAMKKIDFLLITDTHNIEIEYLNSKFGISVYSKIVRLFEKWILQHSDLIIVCSKREKEIVNNLYNLSSQNIIVVPNGTSLDETLLIEDSTKTFGDKKTILFIGKLDYGPNRKAVDYIVEKISPRMMENNPSVIFVIIGGPKPPILAKNVVFTGYVHDIKPYLRSADICIAPIFSGSGTRLKVLEYMAYKKPVVSTSKGVEGIDGMENHKNVVIADDEDSFYDAISNLLNDSGLRKTIGCAGNDLAQKYSWNRIVKDFQQNILYCLTKGVNK
jgi:glycosyltransferase involved in cell wall biosynthesis